MQAFTFALVSFLALASVRAQKINATLPAGFTEFEPEVKQRQDVNYTGFVFSTFDPAQVGTQLMCLCPSLGLIRACEKPGQGSLMTSSDSGHRRHTQRQPNHQLRSN